jgi:heparosan-N-sulfate-glucuronate 5-epimerase
MIDKIRNWKLQASGKSYWHQPLPMSEGFESSNLDFYFIDNSSKTNWQGATNKDGLPLLSVAGDMVLFPTTIFQKTLGHWNKFQGSPDDCSQNAIRDISQFWNGANWAIQNIDAEGGWKLPFGESVYSSMTQGQGISVLVRAHRLGGDERYMQSAIKALRLLEIDDVDGGVVSRVDGLPFLEEFPNSKHRAVLNGAIFALFGLHDLRLSTQTRSQDLIFDKHVK